MNIKNLFGAVNSSLGALSTRLAIQAGAVHDKQDKEEMLQFITEVEMQARALECLKLYYAAILQCAIDTGMAGKTHTIVVYDGLRCENSYAVSTHEFVVEEK